MTMVGDCMDFVTSLILVVFFLVLLIALVFTLIGLPGNWLMMLAIAFTGLITKGDILSLRQCIILVGILLLGEIIEFVLPLLGARRYKPSSWAYGASIIGAIVGGIMGTALIPFIGGFIGAAVGVFFLTYLVESLQNRGKEEAQHIARSAMIGSLLGMTIKLSLAVGILCYIFVYLVLTCIGSL